MKALTWLKQNPDPNANPSEHARRPHCVICGKYLSARATHVDTCGERCFKRLLRIQRAK